MDGNPSFFTRTHVEEEVGSIATLDLRSQPDPAIRAALAANLFLRATLGVISRCTKRHRIER